MAALPTIFCAASILLFDSLLIQANVAASSSATAVELLEGAQARRKAELDSVKLTLYNLDINHANLLKTAATTTEQLSMTSTRVAELESTLSSTVSAAEASLAAVETRLTSASLTIAGLTATLATADDTVNGLSMTAVALRRDLVQHKLIIRQLLRHSEGCLGAQHRTIL